MATMPFDPADFEAEAILKLISSGQMPSFALDALEAGFNGPHIVRMAILDPADGWAIDQVLPRMLDELGCHHFAPKEAALHLAEKRAKRILATGEDPLPSLSYFYRLVFEAGYTEELYPLGSLEDLFDFRSSTPEKQRALAYEHIRGFLADRQTQQQRGATPPHSNNP
ncbi:hypothetical protein [Silvibacterium sp.]|uniref:hypothetical protein n=1 Tax=Silvibacterium sp. TaxID=1964179 RepID=UPI0039E5B0C9